MEFPYEIRIVCRECGRITHLQEIDNLYTWRNETNIIVQEQRVAPKIEGKVATLAQECLKCAP